MSERPTVQFQAFEDAKGVTITLGTLLKLVGWLVVIIPFAWGVWTKLDQGAEDAQFARQAIEAEAPLFDSIFGQLEEQTEINQRTYCRGRLRDEQLRNVPLPAECEAYR